MIPLNSIHWNLDNLKLNQEPGARSSIVGSCKAIDANKISFPLFSEGRYFVTDTFLVYIEFLICQYFNQLIILLESM